MKVVISIIIIVKDDRGISATLAGLDNIAKPAPTEIIVVDASSRELLSDMRKQFRNAKWVQYRAAKGPKSSIPEQRNLGIKLAKGEIIVFIDANCVPIDTWLTDLVKPILEKKETMTAGSVTASNPRTHVNLNRADRKDSYLNSSPTINLAFRKNIFDEVGGFDESLHYGSDVDFTWRCNDRGYRIRFVPAASVSHNWGTTRDEVKRSYKYGSSKAVLYAKHPKRLKELLHEDIFVPFYITYFLLLPVTFWLPWYPLVIILPMLKNINSKPIKTVIMNILFTAGFVRQSLRGLTRPH